MARGITETDVHTAADELVAAGERPTVDRIRSHLGTGSPNTVTRWLETWWRGLAPRLSEHDRVTAMPEVPKPVATAMTKVWERALAEGRLLADAALDPQRQALAQDQAVLDIRLIEGQEQIRRAHADQQQAMARASAAETALAVSEQHAGELATVVSHLQRQHEELSQRHHAQAIALQSTLLRMDEDRAAAMSERQALRDHLRLTEDRAYAEVDRLRQELKASQAQLRAQAREHTQMLQEATRAQRAAEKAQHAAERDSASARARIEAMGRTTGRKAPPTKRTATAKKRRTLSADHS